MAYSRVSIPLFTIFIVAIAAYMAYLIAVKNIFNIAAVGYSSNQHSFDATAENDSQNLVAQNSIFDTKKLKKAFSANTKKIIQIEQPENTNNSLDRTVGAAPINNAQEATTQDSLKLGVVLPTLSPQQVHAYELKSWWDKYSARVPRLYMRPLSADTETILGRVGQISMGLDLVYQQDTGVWMIRVEEAREELISIATKGEREGARALSFQYFRPPFNKTADSVAWAMIANAIAPSDYYLSICANESTACAEDLFAQASEQAKKDVVNYGFALRK